MREYDVDLVKALSAGITRTRRGYANPIAFETCHNMIPGDGVLSGVMPLNSLGTTNLWPANQVFEGDNYYALEWSAGGVASLYSLDPDTVAKTEIFSDGYVLRLSSGTQMLLEDSGTLFQYLTRGESIYATNGTVSLTNTTGTWAGEYRTTGIIPRTVCDFQGRSFYGGLRVPSGLSASHPWNLLIEEWKGLSPQNTNEVSQSSIGDNWIFYMPTGERLANAGFNLEVALFSNYETEVPFDLLQSFIVTGEAGFIHVDTTSIIRTLKPLGSRLIVYGDVSVSEVQFDQGAYLVTELSSVGIPDRCSVAGDVARHVFVNTRAELRLLEADMKRPGDLDFFTQMKPLIDAVYPIVVLHDPNHSFYITNGQVSYTLTESLALCTTQYAPSYIGVFNQLRYAYYTTIGTTAFLLVTTPMRISRARFKVLDRVEVMYEGITDLQVGVDYRYIDGNFTTGTLQNGNNEGVFFVRTCAPFVRLRLTGTQTYLSRIDEIRAKWHVGDGRYNPGLIGDGRGLYQED